MKKIKTIVYAFLFLLSLVLILNLKSIPSGQLWKNYSVIYVPVESSDSSVLEVFNKEGIKNVVSLSGQFLPALISENSPEYSMYKINKNKEEFSYTDNRNLYFFDKSNNYRLYYIPSEYKSKVTKAISLLNSKHIQAGIDSNSSYPWILPVLITIFAIFLLFFSKNKIVFSVSAFLSVVFVYCNPFYPITIANLLIQLILFFVSNIWKRKGFLSKLYSNIIILIMFVFSIITPFSCSLKSGFLFIICIIGITSGLLLTEIIQNYFDSKFEFKPILIRPAKMISIYANKQRIVVPSVTACSFIVLLFFVLLSSDSINAHFSKIQLPSPTAIQSDALPNLNDYYAWSWKIKTAPYISLNKETNPKIIEFSSFDNINGIITENVQTMAFNQEFIDNTFDEIDNFGFESIEKVLKSQKKEISTGYSSTSSYHIGFFGIIMMIFCISVLLFIYISIIIRKGAKK